MSAENVELLRRAWDTFVRRDPAGLDFFAEEIVYEVEGPGPQTGIYHGREGYLRLLRAWTEVWGEYQLEPREFIDGGDDKVIVVAHQSGRSRMTQIRFENDNFYVYDVRGDKLARIRQVPDRATAFRIVAEETGG
jgi:ketosteroid isomerase-like protein